MAQEVSNSEAVWRIYTEVREEENHFNALQADYRKLAATWSLALFAAVAFFLFPDGSEAPLEEPPAPAAVEATSEQSAIGPLKEPVTPDLAEPKPTEREASGVWLVAVGTVHFIGVCILFVMDIVVYHRLLLAAFFVGKLLEENHCWLPPMRMEMENLTHGRVMRGVRLYYAASAALGGALATTFFVFAVCSFRWSAGWVVVSLAISYLVVGSLLYLILGCHCVGANEEVLEREFKRRTGMRAPFVGKVP